MLNKVIIEGRLTADPELRQTPTGVSVCRFSIAWNGQGNEAKFFNTVAWRGTAEFVCRYFKKGSGIVIDGHLDTRTYEAKVFRSDAAYEIQRPQDTSKPRAILEIVVDSVHFPVSGGKREEEAPTFKPSDSATFEDVTTDEKLPF